jgi:hypothetical protein
VHVEYVSVDAGVDARAEADWIAEPPKVFRDHRTGNPELTWTVLLHSRPVELPSRTYHEVEVRGDGLVDMKPGVLTLTLKGLLLMLRASRGQARSPRRGNLGPARVRRDGDDAATLAGRRDYPAAASRT